MNEQPTFSLSLVPSPPADAEPQTLDPAYADANVDFEPALIFEPILSIPLLADDDARRIIAA